MATKPLLAKVCAILGLVPLIAISASPAHLCTNDPINQCLYDVYPLSFLYYYGITGSDALARMVYGNFHRWPESIQSLEVAQTLSKANFFRRLFQPLVGVVQIAGIITERRGMYEPIIYEVDPYIAFRWANFPWNPAIVTSFAIGEGISYASSVPTLEKIRVHANAKRFLNFLMLEATFASPNYPRLQLVTRIHHRSGAFGLYKAGNTGSNDICLGIRYLFEASI